MAPSSNIDSLMSLYIDPQASSPVTNSQLEHRIHIVRDIWAIPEGARVLEIGPGQGDCTLVLAAAVGDKGHVDAVDPCDLDYGSPYTVGESQSHISSGPLGPRITFIQSAPRTHLSRTPSPEYTHVVLCHALWYFDAPATITALLTDLATLTPRPAILIAEWSLAATLPAQIPHVLAAVARTAAEARRGSSGANVRTAVGPRWVKAVLEGSGVGVRREEMVCPAEGLLDGRWEVADLLGEGLGGQFGREVEGWFRGDERAWVAWGAGRDALRGAVEGLEGGVRACRSMMVWVAEF